MSPWWEAIFVVACVLAVFKSFVVLWKAAPKRRFDLYVLTLFATSFIAKVIRLALEAGE